MTEGENDLSINLKNEENNTTVNDLSKNDLSIGVDDSKDQQKEKSQLNQENVSLVEEEIDPLAEINEFKVILLGDTAVGKTSIFNKFTTGEFSGNYRATLTVEFKCKLLKLEKNVYARLTIWDTMGTEKFRAITKQYFRGAHGIILVFDLTDMASFNGLEKWVENIKSSGEKRVEVILVGNKSDLEDRKVTESQVKRFAFEHDLRYIEASAKEGTNILLIFEQLAKTMNKNLEKNKEEYMNSQLISKKIEVKRNQRKQGCC